MQVHSIISNTITQDIRQKGHQSIRFAPDGFSILISDASYRPVFLKQYEYDPTVPVALHPQECERVLRELDMLSFEGETIFISDSPLVTLVPEQLFILDHERILLDNACNLTDTDQIYSRKLKDRPLFVLYAISQELKLLTEKLTGEVKILHASECLISLSDQVQASDH